MQIGLNLFNYCPKSIQPRTNNSYQTQPRQIQQSFCGDVFVPSKQCPKDATCVAEGTIYNKKTKEPIPVKILQVKEADFITTYHFLSEDGSKIYGYATFALLDKPKNYTTFYNGYEKKVLDDYPELGIVGPRMVVDYLKNYNHRDYGGIGFLSDKLGVKHCLDNGFPPLIISEAAINSQIAHYKRGKRFLPLEEGSKEYNFFMNKYGTADVNAIIKESLEKSNGEKLDVSDWPNLIMRLSEEKVEQYKKELEQEQEK